MRPLNLFRIALLFLAVANAGCKKGNGRAPSAATVYLLAVKNDTIFTWKNGAVSNIYSQSNLNFELGPSALAIENGHTYVAGWQPATSGLAYPLSPAYWLDASAEVLPDSTGNVGNGLVKAVAISGNDVYTAGIRYYDVQTSTVPYTGDNGNYPLSGSIATVWKNGIPTALPGYNTIGVVGGGQDGLRLLNDYVSALYVSGADVYIAGGSLYVPAHARYWVNGVPHDLDSALVYRTANGGYGCPTTTGICVSGPDVYVSGSQSTGTAYSIALYWKNGNPVFLSTDSVDGSAANAIAASGSDVYAAGWQNIDGYSRAMLWKNGAATALTSGNTASVAMSVCLHNNDVYVAGYTWLARGNYIATYWKNGVAVPITDATTSAIAYSIVVQ